MEEQKHFEAHCSFGKQTRHVVLEVGKEYVIQPMNPKKKKGRGRHCLFLGPKPVSEYHPRDLVAKVRYLDTNRVGQVDPCDLVPIGESETE